MMDFKLGDDGDLILEEGKLVTLKTIQESVRQRIQVRLNTFLGEYYLDTTVGIPYRQQIFAKGLTKPEIDALFISEINKEPEVIRIVNFSSEQNKQRGYVFNVEVLTTDGLIRVVSPEVTPNEEEIYPIPPEFVINPSCTLPTGSEVVFAGDGVTVYQFAGTKQFLDLYRQYVTTPNFINNLPDPI